MSRKLPHAQENVCIAVDDECSTYAIGSKTNTDLIDTRTLQSVKKIPNRNNKTNIRSVSFKGNILTIGSGGGTILFWDVRAQKYLDSTVSSNRIVTLNASRGWLVCWFSLGSWMAVRWMLLHLYLSFVLCVLRALETEVLLDGSLERLIEIT